MFAEIAFFNFISAILLKAISISYQSTADPIMFNVFNLLICLSKIIIIPLVLVSSNIVIMFIALFFLTFAPFFYTSTILSMILMNTILTKILSDNDKMSDVAKYNFLSKIGSLLGIMIVPSFIFLKKNCPLTFIYCWLIFIILFIFCIDNKLLRSKESRKNFRDKNIVHLLKNSYKYKDIIAVYIVCSALTFTQSNIAFLTGNHYMALIPCFALLCLSFRDKERYNEKCGLAIIFFSFISCFIFKSLLLFLFSLLTNVIMIETKVSAREKYGDSVEPCITAHLITDIISAMVHSGFIVYLLI